MSISPYQRSHGHTVVWRMLATLFFFKRPTLNCPICGQGVVVEDFARDLHVRCPGCEANLVLVLGYNWLYTTICVAVGVIAAYMQGLRNPVFLMRVLIYSAVLVVVAAPVLAPFFPPKLKLASNYVQTLSIPTNGRDSSGSRQRPIRREPGDRNL